MITKLRKRIESEKGFTLIEMLIVIIILGILIAIAVPAYLGFRERAHDASAKSNVRAAVPAVEAYGADNDGYTGMDTAALLAIDAAIAVTVSGAVPTDTTYCIQSVEGGQTWSKAGPSAAVVEAACA